MTATRLQRAVVRPPAQRPAHVPSRARHDGAFAPTDWSLLFSVAAIWGASFLLIQIGDRSLKPELVATLRLAFGASTLAAIPSARRPVPRSAWWSVALLGVVWMALPFSLFALAERQISSSLAGMLNGAAPLFTALIAAVAARRLPPAHQRLGLAAGFAGVILICAPSLGAARSTAAGIGLVLLATLLYGVAFNLAPSLERRHGALPVIWRAQLVALAVIAPLGIMQIPGSGFAWESVVSIAALGGLGTAIAFVAFATLAGRVGSTRASVSTYFLPAVAIALGAIFHNEQVAAISLAGALLVAAGAYAMSRWRPNSSQQPQPWR
jgi:drug/metabolite transporter (DMT)-like permease